MANNNFPIDKPLGKNSVSSLKVLFEDREYYYNTALPVLNYTYDNKIQFGDLIKNDALFGLLDSDSNVILPIKDFIKEIRSGDENPKYAMDFVVDAFNEMNSYLSTAMITGKISNKSPYTNLKIYRGYVDPVFFIDSAQANLSINFNKYVFNTPEISSLIKDPVSFNKKFISYLKQQITKDFPVTATSIVLSTNFSSFVSGLILDIAKDKADDDTKKFDKYFLDKDFGCFADACKRFGFKIDANVPWRLITDLQSPAMKERTGQHIGYMLRYNITNSNDLYNQRYYLVSQNELQNLKDFFFKCYLSLINEQPFYEPDYKSLSKCDFNKSKALKRPTIKQPEYYKAFSDQYWMRVYVYLRNYEEKTAFSQQQFENIVREANNFVSANRNSNALEYVNNYFKGFKKVHFFSSLQQKNKIVQQTVQSNLLPDLIF